jgi:cation diffusion facilitator family transporter
VAYTERTNLLKENGLDARARDMRTAVQGVVVRVLVLNLAVAAAKIVYGAISGTISILSDGFHSLADSASNVVALVGIRLSSRPPDLDHPYGHQKYEPIATVPIVGFMMVMSVGVVYAAIGRMREGTAPEVPPLSFIVMLATLAVNTFVVVYERRAARRYGSMILAADSSHTLSDIFTSLAVIAALVGVRLGMPILDPIAALVVAGFIAYAGFSIATEAAHILSDRIAIAEEEVRTIVMSMPVVLGCHQIRTRGTSNHVFLDLHIWLEPSMRLDNAHAVSHEVKDRLMKRYPQIADAVIHIEPPPRRRTGD